METKNIIETDTFSLFYSPWHDETIFRNKENNRSLILKGDHSKQYLDAYETNQIEGCIQYFNDNIEQRTKYSYTSLYSTPTPQV